MPAIHRAQKKNNLMPKQCYKEEIYWNKEHPARLSAHSNSGISQHRCLHLHSTVGAIAELSGR